MIIVKPRVFKVKFLDGSSVYYISFGGLVKALQSYPLEELKKIKSMKLLLPHNAPPPLPEGW